MDVRDEIFYNELYAEYCELLSPVQKEVFELYSEMDLSLGEIAEMKNISRQSVADAVNKAKKQLLVFENKLKLNQKKKRIYQLIDRLSEDNEYIGKEIKDILGDN